MPLQRRYSDKNDEFSLEQRLVMQLSAAMNQDDHHDRPADEQTDQHDPSTQRNDIDFSALLGSLNTALHEPPTQNPESSSHQVSHDIPNQEPQSVHHNVPQTGLSQTGLPQTGLSQTGLSHTDLNHLESASHTGPDHNEILDVNAILAGLGSSDHPPSQNTDFGNLNLSELLSGIHPHKESEPFQTQEKPQEEHREERREEHPVHSSSETSLPSTTIDPDVSSIQSVLQMLLAGGSVEGQTSSAPAAAASSSSSSAPSNAKPDAQPFFGLDLGAEEQNIIETLKNAMSGSATDSSNQYSSGRVEKPRPIPRMRQKPRPSYSSERFSSSSQSDFNASDPDTLRAIQQALLGALGPSAASSSLAESLTSEASTQLPSKTTSLIKPHWGAPAPPKPAEEKRLSVAHPPPLAGTAFPPRFRPEAAASPVKEPPKFPLPKIAKASETERQKQREDNNARKRKWREMNHMQNRDRDLRLRIVKRANEVFGEPETADKSSWIEQEFNRRRQRRVLRAGIHSIVESARARALKTHEESMASKFEQPGASPGIGSITQQSKQAASTHLSKLFRSSNAALEPQLHIENLTVPLAPYMLIASPKRPPFKLNWPPQKTPVEAKNTESHTTKETSTETSTETPKETPKDTSKETRKETQEETSKETRKETSTETSQDVSMVTSEASPKETSQDLPKETPKETPKEPQEEKVSSPRNVEVLPSKDPSSPNKTPEDSSSAPQANEAEDKDPQAENSKADPALERPKHRYGLIGGLRLGVPPNLTAIYRRIRGRSPLTEKAASPANQETLKEKA